MITTFQESSWGTTEIARPVGHSQMSSISVRIADSSSSGVFAGFFKFVPFTVAERDLSQGRRRDHVPHPDHFACCLSGLSAHLRAAGILRRGRHRKVNIACSAGLAFGGRELHRPAAREARRS
jgi:hypothetical protein